jgi:hypothetical protein
MGSVIERKDNHFNKTPTCSIQGCMNQPSNQYSICSNHFCYEQSNHTFIQVNFHICNNKKIYFSQKLIMNIYNITLGILLIISFILLGLIFLSYNVYAKNM